MTLRLTIPQAAAIRAHAAAEYPRECCGLLLGRLLSDAETGVDSVWAAVNTRADRLDDRYEIAPDQYRAADKAARAHGASIIGCYHSHPDAPAVPSETDRERAWPGFCYVIVSVVSGRVRAMNGWRLRDDRSQFDREPIEE